MRRIFVLRRSGRRPVRPKPFLATGKAYAAISFCSMLAFVLLGIAGELQNRWAASPAQSMKGFAASVSDSFFSSLLGMELPHMQPQAEQSPLSADQMAAFLVRFMTDLNPNDPKSLLQIGMPAVNGEDAVLLRPGSGGDGEAPEDRGPDGGDAGGAASASDGGGNGAAAGGSDAGAAPKGEAADSGTAGGQDGQEGHGGQASSGADGGGSTAPSSTPEPNSSPAPQRGDERKIVFIYHSHNRESWFPELKPGTKDPNDDKTNVTLVGKRMADKLESLGIGTVHSDADYASTVPGYNWNYSYKYSLQTLKEAMADHRDLKFFFDIHRDSLHRKDTTATIGGQNYAQVFFIIGHRNPNWEENEAFANSIHEVLEKDYPGLSKGIWGKTAASGNGEYNQSVSPDSVLIEIGGVDNTLEECYRTADVLAKVVAELIWKDGGAVKASGHAESADAGQAQ